MIFSNFVATIRADLDAIKDDLDEFVTTVKTDTTAMLGLNGAEDPGAASGSSNGPQARTLQWEEVLWDNPELLCEDPTGEEDVDWQKFSEAYQASAKEDEIEGLLASSEVVPELYRELVPARTTHADFFKRMFYQREKLNKMLRSRVQDLVLNDEEETTWEDESVGEDEARPTVATSVVPETRPNVSSNPADQASTEEIAQLKTELTECKQERDSLLAKVAELEAALKKSEAQRADLEARVSAQPTELPHKKVPTTPPSKAVTSSTEEEEEEPAPAAVTPVPPAPPKISATQPSPSWEALPTSPSSSSNEEPVVLTQSGNEEEDDWE